MNKILRLMFFQTLFFGIIFANQEDRLNVFDSEIYVFNKSNNKIYVAAYYQKSFFGFKCKRCTKIYKINSKKNIKISRPDRKLSYDRKIVFSTSINNLKKRLSKTEYNYLNHVEIGNLQGDKFYIISRDNVLYGYNYFDWKILEPFKEFLEQTTDPFVEKIIREVAEDLHYNKQKNKQKANLTLGRSPSNEEASFVLKRGERIKQRISNNFGLNLKKAPNVAFCFSGGGYRAMISTLGVLEGAKKTGVLDLITYFSSLSGSTWLIAPWISSGLSLKHYRKQLKKRVSENMLTSDIDLERFFKNIVIKKLFGQGISLIDLYAEMLQSKFYDGISILERETISNSKNYINDASYPMPIYTCGEYKTKYNFYEFTPFDSRSFLSESYIPAWAFGRKFINGKSVDFAPEQSMSYLNAICGSAYSASLEEVLKKVILKAFNDKIFKNVVDFISKTEIGDLRAVQAKHFNQAYGVKSSEFKNIKKTTFLDAGIFQNLPVAPFLIPERKIDLIIAFDFTRTKDYAERLKEIEKYAKEKNLKLPKINYENIQENSISIFKDEKDLSVPTIIFIPLKKDTDYSANFDPNNADFCSTFNLEYSSKQFDILRGAAEFCFVKNKDMILEELLNIAVKKNM